MKSYSLFAIGLSALIAAGCAHEVQKESWRGGPERASIGNRNGIAQTTCEAQYKADHQNYLSAIQFHISQSNQNLNLDNAPLDRFRAEVNAAYNTVVARCKTHTHCLEVQRYNEAKCYIAAYDRKDAERRFADLSIKLREIERQFDAAALIADADNGTSVTVNTTVKQHNKQKASQKNKQNTNVKVGDDIADQDVLVLCGNAGNLLHKDCRKQCGNKGC
ncbi:MAG: hypothetical protein AAGD92_14375 [Pseudomonadota bacterium]